jgi:hypothetical protein
VIEPLSHQEPPIACLILWSKGFRFRWRCFLIPDPEGTVETNRFPSYMSFGCQSVSVYNQRRSFYRPELGQRIIFMVFIDDLDPHADLDFFGRAIDDIAD